MSVKTTVAQSVAEALIDIEAVSFSRKSPFFIFQSDISSPMYIDTRQLIYHPPAWRTVINGFISTSEKLPVSWELLAGVAVGAVPHSSALAYTMGCPSVFIRKENKGYGKALRIEGGRVNGKSLLLIEDLVTTGGSSLLGIRMLRESGAIANDVVSIVSYGLSDTDKAFEQAGVKLHTLTDIDTLLEVAVARNAIDAQVEVPIVRDWLADPYNWERTNYANYALRR